MPPKKGNEKPATQAPAENAPSAPAPEASNAPAPEAPNTPAGDTDKPEDDVPTTTNDEKAALSTPGALIDKTAEPGRVSVVELPNGTTITTYL